MKKLILIISTISISLTLTSCGLITNPEEDYRVKAIEKSKEYTETQIEKEAAKAKELEEMLDDSFDNCDVDC